MAPVKQNYTVYQGSTFQEVIRWESATKVYIPITGASKSAPLVISATAHGMPAGWRCKISNVSGMKELNSDEYIVSTSATSDSITFNNINSLGYSTYVSGGVVEYYRPIDLTGYTAKLQIREKLNSDTVIKELNTTNGGIVLDTALSTITLNILAADTAEFTFKSAVYSLELISGATVTQLMTGSLSLVPEITR
jgi:hypothetical protein